METLVDSNIKINPITIEGLAYIVGIGEAISNRSIPETEVRPFLYYILRKDFRTWADYVLQNFLDIYGPGAFDQIKSNLGGLMKEEVRTGTTSNLLYNMAIQGHGDLIGVKVDKVQYFRELTNFLGVQEIEGLELVSDSRINEIYEEVRNALNSIASKKNETIPERVIDCLVRDLLMDEVHDNYEKSLNYMKDMYSKHEIKSLFIKGRIYQ